MSETWRQQRAAELRELAVLMERGEVDALAVAWRHASSGATMMHGSSAQDDRSEVEVSQMLTEWVEFPHIMQGEA